MKNDEVSVLFSEPKIPQFGSALLPHLTQLVAVSVLFSEPKIPQYARRLFRLRPVHRVSVLFSEPKIPQFNPDDFVTALR